MGLRMGRKEWLAGQVLSAARVAWSGALQVMGTASFTEVNGAGGVAWLASPGSVQLQPMRQAGTQLLTCPEKFLDLPEGGRYWPEGRGVIAWPL